MALYAKITELMGKGVIVSAYALDSYGVAAALSRMAFGNGLGVAIEETVSAEELFTNGLGDLVAEVPADRLADMDVAYTLLGTVTAEPVFTYGNMTLSEKRRWMRGRSLWKGIPYKGSQGHGRSRNRPV